MMELKHFISLGKLWNDIRAFAVKILMNARVLFRKTLICRVYLSVDFNDLGTQSQVSKLQFCPVPVCPTLLCPNPFFSIPFYSTLFCSTPLYSSTVCSTPLYFTKFCSTPLCSTPYCSTQLCPNPIYYTLHFPNQFSPSTDKSLKQSMYVIYLSF
jgi:hypothetical protein